MSEKHSTGFCLYCQKQKALIKDYSESDSDWCCVECGKHVSLTGRAWVCPKCSHIEVYEPTIYGNYSNTCSVCRYGIYSCVAGCSFTTHDIDDFELHKEDCAKWIEFHKFPAGCIVAIAIIILIILMSVVK